MTTRLSQGHIYIITNTVNNKKYIGQTWYSLCDRWNSHKSHNKRGCPYLYKAIMKHGADLFTIESLARFSNQEEADTLEINYINLHNTTDSELGYNLTKGGQNNKPPMPQEIRYKISKSLIGIKRSVETKNKMSKSQKHKTMSKKGQKAIDIEHAKKRKLTMEQAEQIREERKNGALIRELAAKYNVTTPVIHLIIHNKTYLKNY